MHHISNSWIQENLKLRIIKLCNTSASKELQLIYACHVQYVCIHICMQYMSG